MAANRGATRPSVILLRSAGEAVGLGAGFDDGGIEGEPVGDGGAEAGSVKILVHPLRTRLEAMATLARRVVPVVVQHAGLTPSTAARPASRSPVACLPLA
jgi:hypothetical protein